MPVDSKHKEYAKHIDSWTLTRDAVAGSAAVKAGKAKYLPVPDEEDVPAGTSTASGVQSPRYKAYLIRAVYTNFVGRTKSALVGAVFRKEPEYELPAVLEYMIEDATGDGIALEQLAKDMLGDILETGRGGFLADYTATDQIAEKGSPTKSMEDVSKKGFRANVVPYCAEDIINWEVKVVAGVRKLALVVLREKYLEGDDEFNKDEKIRYRVLRLRAGIYSMQVYLNDGKEPQEEVWPKDFAGRYWDEIPFTFVGSKNNDETIDGAPLYPIADLNIAHYRNSADYEESCFICGQPTLFVTTDMSSEQWKEFNEGKEVKLGARSGYVLGTKGSAVLVQADPNNLVKEAMDAKEKQIIMIGARVITDRSGEETAEAARIRFSSENSVLGDVANNVSEAIQRCLRWASRFAISATGDNSIEYKLNTNFYDKNIDPALIMALVQLLDRAIVSDEDVFKAVKDAGLIDPDRTLEDVQQEMKDKSPLDGSIEQLKHLLGGGKPPPNDKDDDVDE